ncbi:hypothetical protein ACQCSX_08585 [Pseudarthrobacter sp. P1]|uniref:hypothetical protein n=1 Tax=Pseudarthrobacter sp. P1 TaxID=3418418 RepID=UPI003CF448F4
MALLRPRVLAALDAAATAPITIVRAPAGAGKMVALVHWVRARHTAHCIWVSVGAHNAGPAAFWRAVSGALGSWGSPRRHNGPAPDCPRSLAEALSGQEPHVVVVDGFEEITDSEVAEGLLHLVRMAPNVSMVIGTRSEMALEQQRAIIDIDVAVVPHQVRHFTRADTVQLFSGSALAGAEEMFCAGLGGSPQLLRAALLRVPAASDRTAFLHETVLATVTTSIKAHLRSLSLDAAMLGFMEATSVPERFTADLGNALAGTNQAKEFISRVETLGLGQWIQARGAAEFHYVPAVRTALLDLYSRRPDADSQALTRTVIDHELARGNPEQALACAVDIADFGLCSQILLDYSYLCAPGAGRRVKADLERLSGTVLVQHPVLALVLALHCSAHPTTQAAASKYLDQALEGVRVQEPHAGGVQRLALLAVAATALRMAGRTGEGVGAAQQGLALLQQLPLPEREAMPAFEAAAMVQFGLCMLAAGQLERAAEAFELAAVAGGHCTLPGYRFHALSLQALVTVATGSANAARHILHQARGQAGDVSLMASHAQIPFLLASLLAAVEDLDVESAAQFEEPLRAELSKSEHWALNCCTPGWPWRSGGRRRFCSFSRPPPPMAGPVEILASLASMLSETGFKSALAWLPAGDRSAVAGAAVRHGIELSAALAQKPAMALTDRESAVLATLADTGDRAEIALRHFVSVNTVKT